MPLKVDFDSYKVRFFNAAYDCNTSLQYTLLITPDQSNAKPMILLPSWGSKYFIKI